MIDVKSAVKIALTFIGDMYVSDNLSDIRLEEVEFVEEKNREYWYVTIGFEPPSTASALAKTLGERPVRDYKIIKIDTSTGKVNGMVIREPQ